MIKEARMCLKQHRRPPFCGKLARGTATIQQTQGAGWEGAYAKVGPPHRSTEWLQHVTEDYREPAEAALFLS